MVINQMIQYSAAVQFKRYRKKKSLWETATIYFSPSSYRMLQSILARHPGEGREPVSKKTTEYWHSPV
jgi:hypothetical protein